LAHINHFSLERMARGGLYDHLGGGFFRYSVDAHWTIPHFEKMLYDNALLLDSYISAWQDSPLPRYERVIRETADWVIREMQSIEGGYYSTLDADSEGIEGNHYAWTTEQVRTVLGDADYPLF